MPIGRAQGSPRITGPAVRVSRAIKLTRAKEIVISVSIHSQDFFQLDKPGGGENFAGELRKQITSAGSA